MNVWEAADKVMTTEPCVSHIFRIFGEIVSSLVRFIWMKKYDIGVKSLQNGNGTFVGA